MDVISNCVQEQNAIVRRCVDWLINQIDKKSYYKDGEKFIVVNNIEYCASNLEYAYSKIPNNPELCDKVYQKLLVIKKKKDAKLVSDVFRYTLQTIHITYEKYLKDRNERYKNDN